MTIEFALAVEQWIGKAKDHADQALRATAEDVVARVKELTPVRTGFLRANWTVARGDDAIPTASAAPETAEAIAKLRLGDRLLVVNPVVYAARVEFGFVGVDSLGRHYDQKGAGMMQRTINELPGIARRAAARVMEKT